MKRMLTILAAITSLAVTLHAADKQLNLYIWSEYLPDSVVKKFTDKTGIKVNIDTYDANEALEAKLQSGVAGYDLVIPSDYMVRKLIVQKLIQPIDHAKFTNFKNLDPRFLNKKFDPENKYSVPYFWGTTGLGYNKQKIKGPVDSWQVLFDPANKGQILMLDDMRECFAIALKLQGKSLNSTDAAALKKSAAMLKEQKKLVKTYNSGDFANILAAGDVNFAHGYNGQIAKSVSEHPDKLAYVVPKEGATFWMDSTCIPTKAAHLDATYQFINFIHEPEINAEIVNAMSYASANKPAQKFIKPEILNDIAIYPTDDIINRCEFIEDIGEAVTTLDEYWTEIKAQ